MTAEDLFADEPKKADPKKKSEPRSAPLTFEERLLAQNLFDTQPERRKAYFKRLGFELSPDDDNLYRPLGSDTGYAEVDPGVGAYFRKGWAKEIAADLGDIAVDTAVQAPLAAAGAAAGTALGPAGTGVGATAGLIGMRLIGGAAGNAIAEAAKTVAGDLALDEHVPVEMAPLVIQSILVGAAPELIRGIAKGKDFAARALLEGRKKAVVNAASSAGQGVTPEILERAAKEPEMFSKEAVEGATGRLKDLYKNIFGLEKATQLSAPERIKGGIFADAMKPLNEAAEAEIETLSKNPKADFTVGELMGQIDDTIGKLSQKFSRTADEEAALKYFRGKRDFLLERAQEKIEKAKALEAQSLPVSSSAQPSLKTPKESEADAFMRLMGIKPNQPAANTSQLVPQAGPRLTQKETEEAIAQLQRQYRGGDTGATSLVGLQPPGSRPDPGFSYLRNGKPDTNSVRVSFKEGREFLKSLQDDGFDREVPGFGSINQYAGSVRRLADEKAAAAGSKLPEINAKRSQILDTYNAIQESLTPTNIQSAFIGNDTIKKDMVRDAAKQMDQVLGTQYSQAIETGAMQRVVENMYKNPSSFGSGRMMQEGLSAGAKGAVGGGIAGAGVGTAVAGPAGTLPGGLIGALGGAIGNASRATALASPQSAMDFIANSSRKIDMLDEILKKPQELSLPVQMGAAALGDEPATNLAPGAPPKPEIEDLFAD